MTNGTSTPLSPEAENRLREAQAYVKQNINQKNQKVIEDDLWTPNKIYLEFSLCKDYTIGAVYYLIKHDPEFRPHADVMLKGIAEKIKVWQDRLFDDYDEVYGHLPIKWADIKKVLSDQTTHDEVFRLSPNTVFYLLLRDDLRANINHTRVRGKFTKLFVDDNKDGRYVRSYDSIIFTVNTYPLVLSDGPRDAVGTYIANLLGVDVAIMSKDPAEFGPRDTWIKQIEQFYIDKIGRWTKGAFMRERIYESVGYIEQHMKDIPIMDPRMTKILNSNPAWFKGSKLMARPLFDMEYRSTMGTRVPAVALEGVLNHMCLFLDMIWVPTVATRFTPPEETRSRTEELSTQMIDALSQFSAL